MIVFVFVCFVVLFLLVELVLSCFVVGMKMYFGCDDGVCVM